MANTEHDWHLFLRPRVLVHLVTRSAKVTDLRSHSVNYRYNPDMPAYEAWKAETERRRKIQELMTRGERELFDHYWRLKDDNIDMDQDVGWDMGDEEADRSGSDDR